MRERDMNRLSTALQIRLLLSVTLIAGTFCCNACSETDRGPTGPADTSTVGGWTEIPSPVSTHLYRVGFLSPDEVWIVGQSGTILRSRDQGDNWTTVASGLTSEYLYDVDFVGSSVYICGSEMTLLKGISTESGYQWSSITIPDGMDFYRCVQFANNATGWVLETNWHYGFARLWYTGNDGAWVKALGIPYEEDFSARDVHFTSNMLPDAEDDGKLKHEGWLIGYLGEAPGGTGQLYRSANGGKTWSLVLEESGSSFNQLHFIDEKHGWIAKTWGMHATTDGGGTWQSYDFTASLVMPYRLYFTDVNTGWTAMPAGTLHHSTDGGTSWTEQKHDGASLPTVNDIQMINSSIGILACRDGKIYKTTTGGK